MRDTETVYGTDHVNTANGRHSLAEAYRRDGRLAEARALVERAIGTLRNLGLERTQGAIALLLTLGQIEAAEGDLVAAEAAFRKALDLAQTGFGYDSAEQLDATDALAWRWRSDPLRVTVHLGIVLALAVGIPIVMRGSGFAGPLYAVGIAK